MTKRINAAEFRDGGYLQELNRRFLHPLGLALEVILEADGTARFGEVWDYRDDPEGIHFEQAPDEEKARKIESEWQRREPIRHRALCYMIQPPGRFP